MYRITLKYELFGVTVHDEWTAPDEKSKNCMIKSAQDNGMNIVSVVEL